MTRSGLSKSTLRRLETGERVSDVSQLARLAETFEMDFPELVERVSRRRADILREQENGGGDNTPPAEPPVAL